MTGLELYEMKRATGKYDDYNEHELLRLFLDCQRQAELTEKIYRDLEVKKCGT